MRIAIISDLNGFPWAGCEELWAALAARALQSGHTVSFLQSRESVSENKLRPLQQSGLNVVLPGAGARMVRWLQARVSWKMGSLVSRSMKPFPQLREIAPDVIFVSLGAALPAPDFIDDLNRSGATQLPYVLVCHNSYLFEKPAPRSLQQAAAKLYLGAKEVLFVAERTKEETEHLLATHLESTCIVRNPVNLIDISAVPAPSGDTVRMACLSRLSMHSKGQDILFAALSSDLFLERDWALSIYGIGPHLDHLKRLAEHYGIVDRVSFRGHQTDMRAIWAEHHLQVLPSRNESCPLSLVESMLCGRPSVVTDVGGIREWISEPETGFISMSTNLDSYRMALERAWQLRDDWEAIGQRARAKALTMIDPDAGGTALRILEKVVRAW